MRKHAPVPMLAALFLGAVFFLSSAGPVGARPGSGPAGKKDVHPKIESVLTELEDSYGGGLPMARAFARGRKIAGLEGSKITVFIVSEGEGAAAVDADALRGQGAEIVKSGGRIVKARIPLDRIRRIADTVPGVSFIRLPDVLHPLAVTSQGVALTRASEYHASGVDGSGVKVAVIDMGFADLAAAIASGDLPSDVVRVDCTGTACVSAPTTFDTEETEVHGTAVAEIVQDMAPGAEVHLIKIADALDLRDAANYCIANGIRVVNHSVGWVNGNFYDGVCHMEILNAVCTADNAAANGILWVNAAGNAAESHYEATFTDADGDGYHDQPISIEVGEGNTINAYLTWNAWLTTNQDYDLFLLDSDNTVVESSQNIQSGDQTPTEGFEITAPATGTYTLRILKNGGASNLKFELFSFDNYFDPFVAATSIEGPADADSVLAVAAIDQREWTAGPQEWFSSQGPTTDGRIKPDISGPDNVVTTTYGTDGNGNGFFGTSAASPHVAGAAALLLSRNPALTVSELRDLLTGAAIDLGDPGADTVYGAGRLNLQASPSAPDLVSPPDGSTGLSTSVTFTWIASTDPDGDPITYMLYVGTDNGFASVTPIEVPGAFSPPARTASGGRGFLPVLAFGIVAAIGASRKRTRNVLLLAAVLAIAAGFSSCGGGKDEGGGIFGFEPVLTVTQTVSGLTPGTTYYWKVVADDGRGGTADSEVFRFRTAD